MLGLEHRNAVPEIMGLQHRIADQAAVGLAEAPDIPAVHRRPGLALMATATLGPEERGVVRERADCRGHHPVDIALEKLRHDRGQGNVARLAPFTATFRSPQCAPSASLAYLL